MQLYEKTAGELHDMLRKKECSASEAVESLIERIDAVAGKVHAYLTKTPELALSLIHIWYDYNNVIF